MRVEVLRLGHLADGIAAGPVFVAGCLPGEVIEGEVVGDRIERPKIVTPSPDRVSPGCPHYRGCGGCSLMHASDTFVARWKVDIVRQALAAHGLSAELRPIVTSPERSRRRAALSGRRTKAGAIVGLHGKASGGIVEIPECHLLHPRILQTIPALRTMTVLGASRSGELSFAASVTSNGVDLAVSGGKLLESTLFSQLASLSAEHQLARLSWNGEIVVTLQSPSIRIGTATVVPPAGAFLQATTEGETALLASVTEAVAGARMIADLFSGCGTFSLPLARTAEVHGVEGNAAMVDAMTLAWRQTPGLHGLTAEMRDLFRRPLQPDELARFDAVVIDPPRAGAEAQAGELARSAVVRIAYVSCNPITLARDARILCDAGFHIDWVQTVDQFRWSPHVELVAQLSRSR